MKFNGDTGEDVYVIVLVSYGFLPKSGATQGKMICFSCRSLDVSLKTGIE